MRNSITHHQHPKSVSFHHHVSLLSSPPLPCPPRPHTVVRVYEKVWNSVLSPRRQSEKVRELYAHVPVRVCVKQEKSRAGGSGWPPNKEPYPVLSEHGAFPMGGAWQSGPWINALSGLRKLRTIPPREGLRWHLTSVTNQPLAAVHRDKEKDIVGSQQEMTLTPAVGNALGTVLTHFIFPAFLWKHSYRHCTDEDFYVIGKIG